jgi:hypothetical protein
MRESMWVGGRGGIEGGNEGENVGRRKRRDWGRE